MENVPKIAGIEERTAGSRPHTRGTLTAQRRGLFRARLKPVDAINLHEVRLYGRQIIVRIITIVPRGPYAYAHMCTHTVNPIITVSVAERARVNNACLPDSVILIWRT